MAVRKIVAAAASSAGGAGLDVDECFSCHLYDGTGSSQTITNSIDLTEGGLIWVKNRGSAQEHVLFSSETSGVLSSDSTAAISSASLQPTFNSNGFTIPSTTWGALNQTSQEYVSWTFRKAPKFFDVVTWTGNASNRAISHNLGSVPAMIIVKSTSVATDWTVYHVGIDATSPENYHIVLNSTAARSNVERWNSTAPTSTEFTVGASVRVNGTGETYVAYLFAHNNNDGGFGPDGDQDIIKCGSYSGNGSSTGPVIDLGFEPQWLMIKNASTSRDWLIFDNMRGITTGGNDPFLIANGSAAEENNPRIRLTSTGFQPDEVSSDTNNNGETYIYMAIRRGPLAAPDDATKVFDVTAKSYSGQNTTVNSGFSTDFNMLVPNRVGGLYVHDRLRGELDWLRTSSTGAETTETGYPVEFDHQDGIVDKFSGGSNGCWWQWKRAPSYFDVVCYLGDGTSSNGTRTAAIPHNLGVQPEMAWIKRRDATSEWVVAHKDVGAGYLNLNNSFSTYPIGGVNHNDAFTATNFKIGTWQQENNFNYSGATYVAYLFASVAGVSKISSVVHSGTTNVDAGFSNGSRFVLLKRTDADGDWLIWDGTRGIVSGNDPYLALNSTAAEVTNTDYIDPLSSGFTLTSNLTAGTYIYYAIA